MGLYFAHQDLHQGNERLNERLLKLLTVSSHAYHGASQREQLLDNCVLVFREISLNLVHVRACLLNLLRLYAILALLEHLDVVCDLRAQERLAKPDDRRKVHDTRRRYLSVVLL